MTLAPIERLMRHEVTLLKRLPVDEDADTVYVGVSDPYGSGDFGAGGYAAAASVPAEPVTELEQLTRCELQPTTSTEAHDGAVQIAGWRVFLPADAPATGWDAIRLADGTVLELIGDAGLFVNPRTGEASHVEAIVRRSR